METKMETEVSAEQMQTDQNEANPMGAPAKQTKRKKKNKKPKYDPNKNPIQVINESFPQLEYEFDQTGEGIDTVFSVKTTIEGEEYSGEGTSKQRAKLDLAVKAVKQLKLNQPDGAEGESDIKRLKTGIDQNSFAAPAQFNPLAAPGAPVAPPTAEYDFTSPWSLYWQYAKDFSEFIASMPGRDRDRPLYVPPSSTRHSNGSAWPYTPKLEPPVVPTSNGEKKTFPSTHVIGPMYPTEAAQQGFSQLFTNRPTINLEKARSFPVMVLSEIFPEMKVNWIEGQGRGDRQFKVEAEVQSRRFFGEGRSKKMAKLNLAKTILLCMYDIHDFKETDTSSKPAKPKADENGNLEKKYPLTQLKELVGEVTYEVVQLEGNEEDEEKSFNATVVHEGIAYEAIGKSRNLAKLRVAKKVLEVLKPKGNTSLNDEDNVKKEVDTTRHPTMVFYELYRDISFNETETRNQNGQTEYCMEAEIEDKTYQTKASSKKKAKLRLVLEAFEELRGIAPSEWTCIDLKDVLEDKQLSNNPAANHPIVLLLKLNPQTRFEVQEDYDAINPAAKYKALALVGERNYDGEGPNKKSAKTSAARLALQQLYGIDPDTYVEDNRNDYFADEEPRHELPVDLCNKISKVVQDQYNLVFQGETQCKVIAAFVVENHKNKNEEPRYEVVSIGTGTKCITGNQISHKGDTLNDCHGEVIACRGFRQYLYDNLLDAIDGNENIFVRKPPGRFAIHPDVKVYLYVNTAPCGDGRVFTLQTQQQGAKNKTAGLLRTKIENGQDKLSSKISQLDDALQELCLANRMRFNSNDDLYKDGNHRIESGTIPVPENSVQTSDGILEGERLRTMSCSDKILKWNVLGVQGALLSYFIDPIYIEGIVIGLHYHYDALYRALYKRACRTENFPEPYRINKPALGTPSIEDPSRDTSKATSNSFNWYKGQKTVEAVNATTGQTVILTSSRLSKLEFFNKFMEVLKKAKKNFDPKTYHEAKTSSTNYQKSKECFFKSLDETTCGKWIGKPYEHDMFGY